MENKVVNLKVNLGSSEDDLKKLGVAFKTVDKEATNLDATFEEIYGDLKPLTARMGEQEDRLYELAKAGKQSSQEYKDLLKSVSEYKRVQQQTDLVVDAAAQTLETKMSGSLNAVAGGFSLAQEAVGMFGEESETAEKALLKVQSAMAISQGFESIREGAKSVKALGLTIKATTVFQKLQTAATKIQASATNGATLATKSLRGALISTGIGALVVAAGYLVENFDKVKKVIFNLIPGLSKVGDFINRIVNSIGDFTGATSDASRALDKLKASADKTLSVNKKFLQEHSDQIDEYTKKKIDAKNAYAEAIKEDGTDQIAIAKKLNRELAAIEYSRGDERRKKQKENSEKLSAERKAQAEKDKADRIAKAKEKHDEEYNKEKNLIDEIIKNEKLSFKEKRKNVNEDRILSKADKDKYLKEIEDQEIKSIEEHNKAIDELNKKYDEEKLNREADTAVKKEQLDYERQLAEIEKITINELEKQTLIEKLDAEHKIRLGISTKEDAEKKLADEKTLADKYKSLEEEKIRVKLKALDDIQTIFGAESKIGKAALIAKQLLMAKELAMEVSKTISFALQSSARSTMAVVEGAAHTAKVGFPQNIPLLIGYAVQAAGIYSAIKGALNSAQTTATISSLPSVSSMQPTATEKERAAPNFNVVGTSNTSQLAQSIGQKDTTPVRAYVVAADVSTQQGLDRAIIKTATL